MKIIFICAILAATAILYMIARKEPRHKKQAYGATILVPILGIITYMTFLSEPQHQPVPQGDKARQELYLNNLTQEEIKLRERLESKPGNVEITIELASVLMQKTEYDKAIELLNDTLKLRPNSKDVILQLSVAHFTKGLFLAEQKKHADALTELKKADQIAPKDAPFLRDLKLFITIMENKLKKTNE